MDQVSRPLQVVMLLTFAFAALWFVALRPKAEEVPPPSAPAPAPASAPAKSSIPGGLGKAVDKARATRDQSNAAGATASATTPGAAPPASAPAAKPVLGLRELKAPGAVRAALARNKVVVLLFYTPRASDDRAVRAELGKVARRGGRVAVISAPIGSVSKFGDITAGIQVLQSPTVIVMGKSRQARTFAGYTDSTEIDQAVATALRGR